MFSSWINFFSFFVLSAFITSSKSAIIYDDDFRQSNFQYPIQFYQWPQQFYQSFQQTDNIQQPENFEQTENSQQHLNEISESIEIEDNSHPNINEENKNFLQNIFGFFQRPNSTTTAKPTTVSGVNIVQQRCVEDCIMRPPSQYNPVCGSDNMDYHNEERLNCARNCGVDVTVAHRGTCRPLVSSVISGVPPAK